MRPGIVMLAHEPLDRAAETLRYWADAGWPVVVHLDSKADPVAFANFERSVSGVPGVHVLQDRLRCCWGTWSVVRATLRAVEAMLDQFGDVSHVLLVSGACLPLRPPRDLAMFLMARPDTDFIESVAAGDSGWSRGGFDRERFQYLFPFCYRQRRWLFDRFTTLQRRLGVRRHPPAGITPHLGSQWWCLTRATLERILRDPDRRRLERYFRQVWIPDESFFQSIVRRHAHRIESRSLTFSRFDAQGKPFVFYDDHVPMLRRSGCFLARKIWPGADGVYRAFLGAAGQAPDPSPPNPTEIGRVLGQSCQRRTTGRPGLYNQSRFPSRNLDRQRTAAPYWVFWGVGDLFADFDHWLTGVSGASVHGHLFAPERAQFCGKARTWAGCLPDSAQLRDYNPCGFLTNLLWAGRGMRQCFQLGPRDNLYAADFIAGDSKAHILLVPGAWTLGMSRADGTSDEKRRVAIELHRKERQMLAKLQAQWGRAQVRTWSLAEFLERPVPALLSGLSETGLVPGAALTTAPTLRDTSGLLPLLDGLRDSGLNLEFASEFAPPVPAERSPTHRRPPRLQVVR